MLLFVLLLAYPAIARKVILLDTANATSELRWPTYTNDESGWLEETWRTSNNENRQAYVVCNVEKPNVDNWVRTPYIERRQGARLHVEITFTMRDCSQFPGKARTCKETFTLYALSADNDQLINSVGNWEKYPWTRVDRITADTGRFADREESSKVVNIEVRSYSPPARGVYFAFRDSGACVSILNIRIYYEQCVETVRNYAWFPQTITGADEHSIVETTGHCVANADVTSGNLPKFLCKADGKWDLLDGACRCNAGYVPNEREQTCTACPIGAYKEEPGDGSCKACPSNSHARTDASIECQCDSGYYRAQKETRSDRCTQPPTKPRNVRLVDSDQTSASFEWDEPTSNGGRRELWYRWRCDGCPPDVAATPPDHRFYTRSLSLSSLVAGTRYTLYLYAENDISAVVDGPPQPYHLIEFTTKQLSPLVVGNLRVESMTDTGVTLAWNAPTMGADDSAVLVDFYQLRWKMHGVPGVAEQLQTTKERHHSFTDLNPNRQYAFMVRALTIEGWGSWSDSIYFQPGKGVINPIGMNDENKPTTTTDGNNISGVSPVWLVLIILVVIVVVIVIALFVCARRNGNKQLSDCDILDTNMYKDNMQTVSADYNQLTYNGILVQNTNGGMFGRAKLSSPLMNNTSTFVGSRFGCYKPYVDPLAYEDPNDALMQFTLEIDQAHVFIDAVIGGGEFGEVCKGKLIGADICRQAGVGCEQLAVAIKTLKVGSSDKNKADFLIEASIMGQFDHPNVIRLIGVVTRAEPVMIITEYMEHHSLDSFLRSHDRQLSIIQMLGILRCIACGMKYLSEKSFVHRDLAARNVLIDAQLTCKIADFGLSRNLEGDAGEQVYTTNGGKIPVRWTAPEAITHRKFTTSSDAWSFGVVMWEVCSFGERPYWEWTNHKVISEVQNGYRLPPPMDTPKVLHDLMLQCWQMDRLRRPTFAQIVLIIETYIANPDALIVDSSLITSSDTTASPATRALPSTPFDELLCALGLAHCLARLRDSGVHSIESLASLNMVDYLSYGLSSDEAQQIRRALIHFVASNNRSPPGYKQYESTVNTGTIGNRRTTRINQTDGFFV